MSAMDLVPISAAVVALIGAIITIATFYMNRGKAEEKSEQAISVAITANAKVDLVTSHLAEFKAEIAREYVTINAIDKLEQRISVAMHRLSDEMSRRFDELNKILIEVASASTGKRPSR
jgi:hypothetical protein